MNSTDLLKDALLNSGGIDIGEFIEQFSDGGMKKAAIEELQKKGLPLTAKNLNTIIKYKIKDIGSSIQTVNNLDNCSKEELDELTSATIINLLSKIEKHLKPRKYEYQIKIVNDTLNGKTDSMSLIDLINLYSERGWRLKEILTNELGKQFLGFGKVGINATRNEFVLLFEREVEE